MVLANSFIGLAGVKNIAHRGGSHLAPENTLAAFKNAVALSADYLELDIILSSDDSMMIIHDFDVDRTTNGTGFVSYLTYEQLRALDAGSKFSPAFAGEKIPTFSEVLEIAKNSPNNIGVVAEIKTNDPTAVAKTVAMIQKYEMQSRVIVSSFDISKLSSVKALDSTIRVQLFASVHEGIIDQMKGINGEWVGSNIASQSLVDYAHSKGISFNIWTINGADQMILYTDMGVDAITTDDPKTLKALSDTTAPSDVILNEAVVYEKQVTISWSAASDDESGIAGYEIYRDTAQSPAKLYATVGDTTQFVDETQLENVTFYYRVKAKNLGQLLSANYSNEISAATFTDITKPVIHYVSSTGDTGTVYVEFNERIDDVTATSIENYTINNSAEILTAVLGVDQKTVLLTTTKLKDTTYILTVQNIQDKAGIPNTMTGSAHFFIHRRYSPYSVAHYSLDTIVILSAVPTILDATVNANNGTVKNGPVVSDGYVGNGLKFDGVDDYVEFATSPSFDINSISVTVSLWAALDYLPNELPGAFGPLFDSETDNYVLYEDRGNNQLRFKVTTNGGAARPAIPTVELKRGEWMHIVGVYDGTNAMIYLNGVLKNSLPLSGTVNPGQAATLGKSGTSYFSGKLDNVTVLNVALTGEEVAELYNSTKSVSVPLAVQSTKDLTIPSVYELSQNYPNPFNPATTISFSVSQNSRVFIAVYDLLGRQIATLTDALYSPGVHTVSFNANALSSGMYFYRMKAYANGGNSSIFESTKKLLLMK